MMRSVISLVEAEASENHAAGPEPSQKPSITRFTILLVATSSSGYIEAWFSGPL